MDTNIKVISNISKHYIIQALFRGHYERMSLAEKRGEVQWQRAAVNTVEILRKSGVSRSEASHAAVTIQVRILIFPTSSVKSKVMCKQPYDLRISYE